MTSTCFWRSVRVCVCGFPVGDERPRAPTKKYIYVISCVLYHLTLVTETYCPN